VVRWWGWGQGRPWTPRQRGAQGLGTLGRVLLHAGPAPQPLSAPQRPRLFLYIRGPVTVVWAFFFAYLGLAWLLMSYVKHYKR
jgi:hypothetical protein